MHKLDKEEVLIPDFERRERADTILTDTSNRTWVHRTFGPFHQGSLRIAIFTLVNTAVGTGMLALPQTIAVFGYIPGIAMLFVGALNLYIGLYIFKYDPSTPDAAQIYS